MSIPKRSGAGFWARQALGLKQVDVSARLGVQAQTWSNFESGRRMIHPSIAWTFFEAYGFDLNFIYGGGEGGLSQANRAALAERRRRANASPET